MNRRLTRDGIDWHQMLPIKALRGRWRRPDLRNHRKLLIVDDEIAFMGSQNMIDSSYLKRGNVKIGRHWPDLNVALEGPIVQTLGRCSPPTGTPRPASCSTSLSRPPTGRVSRRCSCCRPDRVSPPSRTYGCSTPCSIAPNGG